MKTVLLKAFDHPDGVPLKPVRATARFSLLVPKFDPPIEHRYLFGDTFIIEVYTPRRRKNMIMAFQGLLWRDIKGCEIELCSVASGASSRFVIDLLQRKLVSILVAEGVSYAMLDVHTHTKSTADA